MLAPDEKYALERLSERAAKLIPALRERAIETTRKRRIPDKTIADRLATSGQVMNIGGSDEFAKSIAAQRAQIAEMAKRLGVAQKK